MRSPRALSVPAPPRRGLEATFDDTQYQIGPMTRRVREMYWDWAASDRG